jgi:energy-coupling factor transport system substrate-specific component
MSEVVEKAREFQTSAPVRIGRRSALSIALVSTIGLIAFLWPLFAPPDSAIIAHASDAPWLFAAVVPLVLVVVLAQLADRDMDAKSIALLGVLAAVIAILRPLGTGIAGIEPMWVVLILAGRALGPGFGFALGSISILASALLTGGVGPWLPFQMLGAAWVGMGAGLLPRGMRGAREIVALCIYGAIATITYGFLLNLWFWPFALSLPPQIAFVPGADFAENLAAWWRFNIVTSLGFDVPRAALTVILIAIAGRPILVALRRVSRIAAFDVPVRFERSTTPSPSSTMGS